MDAIPLELFMQKWGPTGLLSLVIILILFGRLIPKTTHDDVRAQRDEYQKALNEALRQNTKLLESSRVADATFKALKDVAEKESEAS